MIKEKIENFSEIINMIEAGKHIAYTKINEQMILLYQGIGKYLHEKTSKSEYGDKIIYHAAEYMAKNYPTIKGYTRRNLERMVQFYRTYKDSEIASTLLTQLSWSHNLRIISGCNTEQERLFYLRLSIKEKYTYRELDRQIQSSYYERSAYGSHTLALKNDGTVWSWGQGTLGQLGNGSLLK